MSSQRHPTREPVSPEAVASGSVEAELRREQLRIIEKTSLPGLLSCSIGSLILLAVAFGGEGSMRMALVGIVTCLTVMAILWAFAMRACRRGEMRQAFIGQLLANLTGTVLFFVFIERGAILGLLTAFVGFSAGAMVLGDRAQRRVAFITTAFLLAAAAIHEMKIVDPVTLPNVIIYGAVAVGIVFGFRTPISAFRMFNKHLQASRVEALRNERLAQEALERADAQARALADVTDELREFTYVVSHDLRAPLINVEGFGEVLRDALDAFDAQIRTDAEPEPAADAGASSKTRESWAQTQLEVAEALHFISSGTAKMNTLINGLLELSRLDTRPATESTIDLAELVGEIVDSMQHQIRDRDVAIEIGPLPQVVGERLRVGQVFANLIDNAIKYMPERPPRAVGVSCEEEGELFVFSVNDSGDGIPVESRQKVFRPFKRLNGDSGPVGEGLGLAAVKKIVERHGGRIWVEENPDGCGASFRFTWRRQRTPGMSGARGAGEAAA